MNHELELDIWRETVASLPEIDHTDRCPLRFLSRKEMYKCCCKAEAANAARKKLRIMAGLEVDDGNTFYGGRK